MSSPGAVTVVGAAVAGLVLALRLAGEGWRVTLVGASAGSASAAAAGMLAPASEALLDDLSSAQLTALRAARSLWTPLAAQIGVRLDTAGTVHVAAPAALAGLLTWAQSRGLACEAVAPGRAVPRPGALFPEDALLEPSAAIAALEAAVDRAGVRRIAGPATAVGSTLRIGDRALEGPCVVAAGWGSRALAAAAPELGALQPIKGQLLRFAQGPAGDSVNASPMVRAPGVYLAPQASGWIAGATMEPGRTDLRPDPAALAALRAAAAQLRPELADMPAQVAVGVRAALPDGAPLVGRSRSGVWLATGLRRNGWLLAPLVAEGIAAYLGGRDPDAALAGQAAAWSPTRIAPQGAA